MAHGTKNTVELEADVLARLAFKRGIRKKRRKEREAEEEAVTSELNITAMMDMMTILLVFLLKSFGADAANVTMNEDLQLPQSAAALKVDELVAVTITAKQILVGDKAVVDLEQVQGPDGKLRTQVPASVRDNAGKGMLIVPVEERLRAEQDKLQKIASYNPSYKLKNQISIVGDREMPYDVLTQVLYTAGKVGLDGYKFVVIRKNSGGPEGG